MSGIIAFQGRPGAYSDLACRNAFPGLQTLPCESFEAAMDAVRDGTAELAMIACENSLAGRVGDVHQLLPDPACSWSASISSVSNTACWRRPGPRIEGLKRAHSHEVALGQVRRILKELGLKPVVQADTAGAAEMVAEWNNPEDCAIASSLAAELFGLQILRRNVEDAAHNTTRFYVMSRRRRRRSRRSGRI